MAEPTHPLHAAPVCAVAVELTLEPAGDGPIAGTVRDANGRPREFCGWLELMDALEDLRPALPAS